MHVTNQNSLFDLIIVKDLLSDLGIILNFENLTITQENAVCGMKPSDYTHDKHYHIDYPQAVQQDSKFLKKMLDANYEKADLPKKQRDIHI